MHILQATSKTFVFAEKFAFSINQFVASTPPGRSLFFPSLAKKVCQISFFCSIFLALKNK